MKSSYKNALILFVLVLLKCAETDLYFSGGGGGHGFITKFRV